MDFRRSSFCDSNTCVEVAFRKSSYCESAGCVEVATVPAAVLLRDSKDPDVVLALSRGAWSAFLAGAKAGEFDRRSR